MSFLDRFSAPLCDFVGQTTDAAAILHELERSNLFLIPLDEDGRWFRFHHLFAAVANGELEADRPEQIPELHARAAQWFREHDHIDDAVRHFLAGGDLAERVALWSRPTGCRTSTPDGRDRSGVARCPGHSPTAEDPAAAVVAAWVAALIGDRAELTPPPDGARRSSGTTAPSRTAPGRWSPRSR